MNRTMATDNLTTAKKTIVILVENVWGRPLDYWFTMNDTYDNGNECHEKPE